jgi:glutathione S-transferase
VHRVLGLPGIARLFRQDRPAWCKEKEYPTIKVELGDNPQLLVLSSFLGCLCKIVMQVPSLEHNNEVKGVSLDLIKCIDSHFDGLSFFPHVRFRALSISRV